MVGKILALGFVPYLRDPWNTLDFVVVLVGFISFVPALGNYSAIRVLRVFRAFKVVTAVPGLQLMVRALGVCMKEMSNPGTLICFAVIFFGIVGLSSFMGVLRQTCVCLPEGYDVLPLLSNYTSEWSNDSGLRVDEYQHCGTVPGSRRCPTDPSFCASAVAARADWNGLNVSAVCLPLGDNPGDGFTSFDNMGSAVLSTIQLITMDWWESIYDGVMQSAGWYTVFYFILIIFLGGYYVINLILAVVTMAYAETKAEVEEEVAELIETKTERSVRKKLQLAVQKLSIVLEMHHDADAVRADLEEQASKPYWETHACAHAIKRVVEHSYFVNAITFLIIINTVTLAMWYPLMPEWADLTLHVLNHVFSAAFLIEVVLKMGAYGLKEYFFHAFDPKEDSPNRSSRNWNWFDFVVVVSSIVELILTISHTSETQVLSVLRTFRIIRILKLGKNWKTMQRLISAIDSSAENIMYLTLVLAIVIYMFAALGMQAFREDYFAALNVSSYNEVALIMTNEPERYQSDVPRWNFINFTNSFMLVFRVLCGEWIEPLHSAMLFSSKSTSVAFFLITLVVGNFVVMNLFIALLLGAFSEQQLQEAQGRLKQKEVADLAAREETEDVHANAVATGGAHKTKVSGDGNLSTGTTQLEIGKGEKVSESAVRERMMSKLCCTEPLEMSLRPLRRRVVTLVTSNVFEGIILLMILWSSIMLAFDDHPNRDNHDLHTLMNKFNIVFAVVFTTEAALKMVGLGWKNYFKDGWNLLDFFLVVVGLAAVIVANMDSTTATNGGLTALRTLRAMRALRPMRAIRKWESMKIIIDALLASIPAIVNVVIFTVLVFIIFAILGVQLFGGKFGYCADFETGNVVPHTIISNRTGCNSTEAGFEVVWVIPPLNFDNCANAMTALFHVAIFEGWMQVMDSATDSAGIEMQPIYQNSYVAYGFFVIFLCLGSFFTLNLFIGVIIDNFQVRKKHAEEMGLNGGLFLTDKQKRFMATIRNAMTKKPIFVVPPPDNSFSKPFFKAAQSLWFEVLVIAIIVINTLFMMLTHYEQSDWYSQMLWIANAVFTGFYLVEAAIKIIGLRRYYFKSAWNIFDFILVVVAVASCIVDLANSVQRPWLAWADSAGRQTAGEAAGVLARLFRIVRVLRFGRLLKHFPRFRRLTTTLIVSLPALVNIFSLLFMIISIFSLVALSLFKDVKQNGSMNDFVNFETFGSSFLLLYRVSSSAGVDEIEAACSIQPPFCNDTFYSDGASNCGSPGAAKIFFLAYVLIAFFVLVNTYIAVILDNLDCINTEEAQPNGVTAEAVESFYVAWGQYDPKATNFIACSMLKEFLSEVPVPLGYKGKPNGCKDADLKALKIPLYTKILPPEESTPIERNHGPQWQSSSFAQSSSKERRSSELQVPAQKKTLKSRGSVRNKVGPEAITGPRRESMSTKLRAKLDAADLDDTVPKAHCTSILKIMIERTLAGKHTHKEATVDEGESGNADKTDHRVEMLIQQSTSKKFRDLSYLGDPFSHTGIYNPETVDDFVLDRFVKHESKIAEATNVDDIVNKVVEVADADDVSEISIGFPNLAEDVPFDQMAQHSALLQSRLRAKSGSLPQLTGQS